MTKKEFEKWEDKYMGAKPAVTESNDLPKMRPEHLAKYKKNGTEEETSLDSLGHRSSTMTQSEMIREYKYVMARRAEINKRYDTLRKMMVDYINDADEVVDSADNVQMTYRMLTTRQFDREKFKNENPELYNKYRIQTYTRFLRNIKKPYPATGKPFEKEESWEVKMGELEEVMCN